MPYKNRGLKIIRLNGAFFYRCRFQESTKRLASRKTKLELILENQMAQHAAQMAQLAARDARLDKFMMHMQEQAEKRSQRSDALLSLMAQQVTGQPIQVVNIDQFKTQPSADDAEFSSAQEESHEAPENNEDPFEINQFLTPNKFTD